MSIRKLKKEEIELLSNKEITYLLLEDKGKGMTTADLFKKIIELKELPESDFESKIGDYYMALSTDKNVVMLDDGKWDLRSRHTSDVVKKITSDDEYEEEEEDEDISEKEEPDEILEDSYDDTDESDYNDSEDDLKDLVVIDEDEMEIDE